MDKIEIEGVRTEFKRLIEAMVDMARTSGQPLAEIVLVMRDAPRTIDELCDLAIKGCVTPPEVGTISWQAQAYVKLGLVRDMMIPADVLTVQQFIGPIPESAPSPLGTIK